MDLTGAALAVPSITIAVLSLIISWNKASKESVKDQLEKAAKIENRMTKIEDNLFTAEDKKCLHELNASWKLFYSIVEKDFPRLMKHEYTPAFDTLLNKLEKDGFRALTLDEARLFDKLVAQELKDAEREEDAGRGLVIVFYKGFFDLANQEQHFGDSCSRLTK